MTDARIWSADFVYLKGFGFSLVSFDEFHDLGFQVFDGSMDAAFQLLAGEFGEPALDLIDP